MKILAIDTSSATATAAVLSEGILIGEYILNNGKTHSQKLMTMIEQLLKDCNMSAADLDAYACSSGPGSFTGLRIGAATIKGMAHAFNKPILGVPSLDILAYGLYGCEGLICPVLDAQRKTVYSALYRWKCGVLVKEEDLRVIAADELIEYLATKNEAVTLLGDGVYLFENDLGEKSNLRAASAVHTLPRAASCAALAELVLKNGSLNTYNDFVPKYIRKSQAEVEYEKKQKLDLKLMEKEDIDGIYEIECMSFKTPWSKEAFDEELEKNKLARYIVAKVDNKVVGYGGMWIVLDEGHITNVAVHPDFRGQKIGERIVEALIELSEEIKIKRMTLEVRPSNTAARNLYKKMGFIDYGIRKGYYYDTGEDAVIMWKEL